MSDAPPLRQPGLLFQTAGLEVRCAADRETRLSKLAKQAGLALNTRCAGKGVCGGCALILLEGRFLQEEEDFTVPAGGKVRALGCKTFALSEEARIFVPGPSLLETTAVAESDFTLGKEPFAPAAEFAPAQELPLSERYTLSAHQQVGRIAVKDMRPEARLRSFQDDEWITVEVFEKKPMRGPYGLAIDVGTTTVAAVLVDLSSGELLRKTARLNGQIECADDVAARISYAHSEDNLRELQSLLVDQTLSPMIEQLCRDQRINAREIVQISAAGNTIMTHLLAGVNPYPMGFAPFTAVTLEFPNIPARELGLAVHPEAVVALTPAAGGYVGGDIIADLRALRFAEREGPALLIDIGTNGEMVLKAGHRMLACATAAGPAFEGGGIVHGVRAARGAIEGVRITADHNFEIQTIGDAEPVGICGSAVIDIIAQGYRAGLISETGRFDLEALAACNRLRTHRYTNSAHHTCVLATAEQSATGEEIYLGEGDIAELLKAKAAIYAGARTLMDLAGLRWKDLAELHLAGGFASHIDLDNAVTLGLLPDIARERIHFVGNTALAGAVLALTNRLSRAESRALARRPEVIELNATDEFEDNFIDALTLGSEISGNS